MSWISTIPYDNATGHLRKLYDRIKGPNKNIDNIMMVHSLRPHTLEGHMAIYKTVLHHARNSLPKWYLETIGVWVSALNHCGYCVEHHFAGLKRLLADDRWATELRTAIDARNIDLAPLSDREKLGLAYAEQLTLSPSSLTEASVVKLRQVGFDDGKILEINQVCAYFNYANRTVLGLGCTTAGDILGLSPNNPSDPDDWSHT